VIGLFLPVSALAKPLDVLFVLFQAGESNALHPILTELRKDNISFQILAVNTASGIFQNEPEWDVSKMFFGSPRDLKIDWNQYQTMNPAMIREITDYFTPRIIITGMVSRFQQQLAKAYSSLDSGPFIIGYFDAFSLLVPNSLRENCLEFVHELWMPGQYHKEDIQNRFPGLPVKVMGQPTLQKWTAQFSKFQEQENSVLKSLLIKPRTVLFIGQYGESYEKAFRLFVQDASNIKDYNIWVSAHPHVDGSFERRVVAEYQSHNIKVLPNDISTIEATLYSDFIVTIDSNVGIQALFMGKPVIYINSDPQYSNIAIEKGWAIHLAQESLSSYLNSKKGFRPANSFGRSIRSIRSNSLYQLSGIPPNSIELITDTIRSKLSISHNLPCRRLSMDASNN